jgi:hypothetical protein
MAMTPSMEPTRPTVAARAWEKRHDVQFYDDDAYLCASVTRFLADGIRHAQPVVVIATPAHRRAFQSALLAMSIDPDALHPVDVVWLDARDTLSAFMEGGRPNAELFMATVGSVFEKVIASRRYVTVRAYGEMVDLLWREGKTEAAIELEELWNGLATQYAFALLCAYSKEALGDKPDLECVARICAVHTNVLPSRPAA